MCKYTMCILYAFLNIVSDKLQMQRVIASALQRIELRSVLIAPSWNGAYFKNILAQDVNLKMKLKSLGVPIKSCVLNFISIQKPLANVWWRLWRVLCRMEVREQMLHKRRDNFCSMKYNAVWIWQPDPSHTQSRGIRPNSVPILWVQRELVMQCSSCRKSPCLCSIWNTEKCQIALNLNY